jgi:hypothetical protein
LLKMCYGYRMTPAGPYVICRVERTGIIPESPAYLKKRELNDLLCVVLCEQGRVIFQCSEARQKLTVDDAYGISTAQYMSDSKKIIFTWGLIRGVFNGTSIIFLMASKSPHQNFMQTYVTCYHANGIFEASSSSFDAWIQALH